MKLMLELLGYLRTNGFKAYLVTGDDVGFVREMAPRVYGIPPAPVIGSTVKYRYSKTNGAVSLIRLAQVDTRIDDATKALAIDRVIGRRPAIAVGNADNDVPMLEWTSTGEGPRCCVTLTENGSMRTTARRKAASPSRVWTMRAQKAGSSSIRRTTGRRCSSRITRQRVPHHSIEAGLPGFRHAPSGSA